MADERTTEIEVVSAPAGYDKTDYQFFKSNSGQVWKASAVIMPAFAPMINGDVEAAPTQLAVSITVSPVDDEGKTLRENDKPIIINPHLHTFTQVEMSEPDFDPIDRVMKIVAERIHIGEARIDAVKKINALGEDWNKKAKVKTGKFTFTEAPAEPAASSPLHTPAPVVIEEGSSVTASDGLAAPSNEPQAPES